MHLVAVILRFHAFFTVFSRILIKHQLEIWSDNVHHSPTTKYFVCPAVFIYLLNNLKLLMCYTNSTMCMSARAAFFFLRVEKQNASIECARKCRWFLTKYYFNKCLPVFLFIFGLKCVMVNIFHMIFINVSNDWFTDLNVPSFVTAILWKN